jgi:hypothetical protein
MTRSFPKSHVDQSLACPAARTAIADILAGILGDARCDRATGYFPPLRHALPQLFSTFVNWFTNARENPGHPVVHRMA